MRTPLPLFALPLIALTACAATEPSRDSGDIRDFDETVSFLERNSTVTPAGALPFGTVNYDGEVGANVRINGDDNYGMVGDLDLSVGFSSGDVNGTVSDIDLLRNGIPDQLLSGELDVNGQEASGKLQLTADGVVGAIFNETRGVEEFSNIHLEMDGQVRSTDRTADTILGTVDADESFGDGFGTGVPPARQFNVFVEDGVFYARD